MTIAEYIDDFLRDAQYRIGELSSEIDDVEDNGSTQYRELYEKRMQLITFMDIVYEGKWYIVDGYNHIQYTTTAGTEDMWTEREVIQEIERLRYYTSMNEMPFINFTAHYPQIVNPIGSGGSGNGGNLPAGLPGDTIFYNASGMFTGESINSYFSNRL
jgi:hypothetical protein